MTRSSIAARRTTRWINIKYNNTEEAIKKNKKVYGVTRSSIEPARRTTRWTRSRTPAGSATLAVASGDKYLE